MIFFVIVKGIIPSFIVEKSEEGIYIGMKQFLKNGFVTTKFDPEEFNEDILEKLNRIID